VRSIMLSNFQYSASPETRWTGFWAVQVSVRHYAIEVGCGGRDRWLGLADRNYFSWLDDFDIPFEVYSLLDRDSPSLNLMLRSTG